MSTREDKVWLSVCIPVYGVEAFIRRCAESLFGQTIKKGIEFIFVDDASPDRSIEILKNVIAEFPERKKQVHIIRHSENIGLAGARLSALRLAKGEYVIACDSDDWVESSMYEKLMDTAVLTNADVIVCGNYINYGNSQTVSGEIFSENCQTFLNQVIRGGYHNSLCNKMLRLSLFSRISPSFVQGVNMWEDASVLARLVYNANSIAVVSVPLYHYYQANNLAYTQKWKSEYSESIDKAVHINLEYFKDKDVDIVPLAQRGLLYLMSNENESNRDKYLMKYCREGLMKDIDYSMYSRYSQILAYLLFNRHYKCADLLQKVKRTISKLIH